MELISEYITHIRQSETSHQSIALAKREAMNITAEHLEEFPLCNTTIETVKCSPSLPEMDCETRNDFQNVMGTWNPLIHLVF